MESFNDNPKIQEHWLWKKNVPFLYDYLLITPLRWPTLTFSIPPVRFNSENMVIEEEITKIEEYPEISLHGSIIFYGSYSNSISTAIDGNAICPDLQENYITVSVLDTPNLDIDLLRSEDSSVDNSNKKLPRPKYLNPDFNSLFRLEVNDNPIRICSKLDDSKSRTIIASKMLKGDIWLHNIGIDEIIDETFSVRAKASDTKTSEVVGIYNGDGISSGIINSNENNSPKRSGYGMEWGITNSSWLLSGNEDSSIFIYDVNSNEAIYKNQSFNLSNGVNDLCWINPVLTPNIFSAVNHQGCLSIYDFRYTPGNPESTHSPSLSSENNSNSRAPVNKWEISETPCVSISVHPTVSNLLSIGGYDGSIYIIDLRYFSNNKQINAFSSSKKGIVNKLKYNAEPVHRLEWHSGGNGLLLSSSLDGKVCIWDITKCNNLPIWEQIIQENSRNPGKIVQNSSPANSRKASQHSTVKTEAPSDQEVDVKQSLKLIINNSSSNWTKNEKLDGPNELVGVHSGHIGYVTDSHWMYSPNHDSWSVISTDSSNGLHVWSFNEAVFISENDLVELSYAKQTNLDHTSIYSTKDSIRNLLKSF
ncbi:Histone acetyltransferase type B subunit 2 [Cryptosporidium felis]|nr:Histone acetyltransferase type B subunit 2 [Cryptosporidium felis]